MTRPLLVTGGLGFIGSAMVRSLVARGISVVNVDKHTYAADERRLESCDRQLLTNVTLDVLDPALQELAAEVRPSQIVHFAAETHVTRSELAAELFHRTNVDGTKAVLEAALAASADQVIHVSTDEVYGPCDRSPFRENDKHPGEGLATSAYAKSKALADDLAVSYDEALSIAVVRPTNCFGPWQHPEKAVGRWTTRALRGLRLPVWGDGRQIRDWMHVEDFCSALELVLDQGATGVYNVGPQGEQVENAAIARAIARFAGVPSDAVYLTEYDRPDHDRRYAVDSSRIRELGWAPRFTLEEGLNATVEWYSVNRRWWLPLVEEAESIYSDEEESRAGG